MVHLAGFCDERFFFFGPFLLPHFCLRGHCNMGLWVTLDSVLFFFFFFFFFHEAIKEDGKRKRTNGFDDSRSERTGNGYPFGV